MCNVQEEMQGGGEEVTMVKDKEGLRTLTSQFERGQLRCGSPENHLLF